VGGTKGAILHWATCKAETDSDQEWYQNEASKRLVSKTDGHPFVYCKFNIAGKAMGSQRGINACEVDQQTQLDTNLTETTAHMMYQRSNTVPKENEDRQ
jgi:hypothetical protein